VIPLDLIDRQLAAAGGVSRRLWERALGGPAREFLRRPGKGMRGQLVDIGFQLAGGASGGLPPELPAALELLHAGSLVLDDIQDGSPERRGGPALHRLCGTPLALNTGNWMVFSAVQLLGQASFPSPAAAAEAQRRTAAALVACHQGQALDLALPVGELEPGEIAEVVAASTRLRTASLTELAAGLGGLAAGATDGALAALCALGRELGVALQQLDDLGAICAVARRGKGLEDLVNARPTWPWAWAIDRAGPRDLAALQAEARAVARGAAAEPLRARLAALVEEPGRARIRAALARAAERAAGAFPPSPARDRLAAHIARLEASYG
jgi:geranylgeranyl pyrophosphate synthase